MFWPHLTLTIYFDLTWPRQYTLTSLDLHNIFWLVDSFDLYSFWLGLSRLIFFVLMVLFLALFRLKISILFYCSSLHFDTDIYMVSDFLDNFPVAWSYLYVTMVVPRMSFGTQVVSFQWKFKVLKMRWFYMVLNWLSIGLGRQSFSVPRIWATISVLWGLVAATGYDFFKIKPWAGYTFLPYLAWVSLATTLNYRAWKLNPRSIKDN